MKQRYIFIFMLICSIRTITYAKRPLQSIRTVTEIEDILPLINTYQTCGPCTLVAFDIDETLIWATKPKARSEWFNEQLASYTAQGLSAEEAMKHFFVAHLTAHAASAIFPVDKDTNLVFEKLAQQNIHVLGLTARAPMMSTITTEQFTKANIKFPQPIPRWNEIFIFDGPRDPVMVVNGIIYSSGQNKGLTLGLFIDALSYKPQLLVFVDDLMYNIKNVQTFAQQRGIPFLGIHITKYEQLIKPLLDAGIAPQTVAQKAGSIPAIL